MTTIYRAVSEQIFEQSKYQESYHKLFEAYVTKLANGSHELDIDIVKKLCTTVQFFYQSKSDKYLNEGANILAMLLDVVGYDSKELIAIAQTIFTKAGDFPNLSLLKKKYNKVNCRLSYFDETTEFLRKELNTINEIDHALTDYQRTLWNDLTKGDDVITAAPTSTGKTHIILRYLVNEIMQDEIAFAAIVVPTRALISEIAAKVYDILKSKNIEKQVEICTVPKNETFLDRTIFVMTQERLFETIQNDETLSFDYLFIDEAHNISDASRGVLLHLTLQKLLENSFPQIVISMPSSQYLNAFDSVFDENYFLKKQTKHSPVAKILLNTSLKGANIEISQVGKERSILIKKQFKKAELADIVIRLGNGESNIIYRNGPFSCENTANKIADRLPETNSEMESLEAAADYVANFIHEDFTLVNCIRKGVAFHYGPLPGVVRVMIENLARTGSIKYIVCTSTLAEGINLPAKNLFLTDPIQITAKGQKNIRLEDVKINNITGRAGRMLNHFCGNVFLVNPNTWKYKDYFEEKEETSEKIPTYFKVLNENLEDVYKALLGYYDHNENYQFTYYTIANKLLKEFRDETLQNTLNAKELSLKSGEKNALRKAIKNANEKLEVASFTLEANPTIGFIQQNKLYQLIYQETDLKKLSLPHPKSKDLYQRLLTISELLYDAGILIPADNVSIKHACVIATKWIHGDTLKSIIIEQIAYDKRREDKNSSCNTNVRNVIKIINNTVRFRMSSALRCFDSIFSAVCAERNIEVPNVKLYTFIEVGGWSKRFLSLVNLGLSRETSLEIDRVLPSNVEIQSIEDIETSLASNRFDSLHIITKQEIKGLFG